MEVKTEPVNGTPLPPRNQKGNQGGAEEDEKPRNLFGQGNQRNEHGGGQRNDHGGGGGQRNMGNRNMGNQNRGGNRFGNRNQGNRGGDGGKDDIPNLMDGYGNRGGNDRGDRRGGGGGQHNRGGNDNRDRRGGGGGGRGGGGQEDHIMKSKLQALNGPTHELPPIDTVETKFSGRNRLYIGNLTNDINEEELKEMFKPYGEIAEAFINADKNFAFLKVDYHANAEKAKRELDGTNRKNRQLRIRFAPNATIVRVKNLTQFVSNELLFKAFEIFGPVERAVIVVDDRGKSTGEGIVEFARKAGAAAAIRYCQDKCFFLTQSLRPCVVEPYEINDDTDGMPDKSMNKKTQEFFKERQIGPRFAEYNSFEHDYGTRWKQLHELFKQKHEALKRELAMEEEKLEAQMEFARYEHETELLREQLRKREEDRERTRLEWEMRQRQHEEMRSGMNRDNDHIRRQQDDMHNRNNRQEEEMKRRQQENTLFMQAQQLNSLLDQQEFGGAGGAGAGGNTEERPNAPAFGTDNFGGFLNGKSLAAGNNQGQNPPNADQGFMPGAFDFGNQNNQQGQRAGGGGVSRWNDQRRRGGQGGNDDFQNKRGRF